MGEAYVITSSTATFPRHWISDKEITQEIMRLKRSIQNSKEQLNRIKEKMCRFSGQEQFNIIESHAMLLQDEMLVTHTIQTLTSQKINAEWALEKTLNELKLAFSDMSEDYFQERKEDIEYIGKRILQNLQGSAEFSLENLGDEKYILVTNDLSPAEVASLPRDKIEGFITGTGGDTSHTAIIARSLEIPAVLGHQEIVNAITMDDKVIIDGSSGEVIINPTKNSLATYQKERLRYRKLEKRLIKTSHIPAKTQDDHRINIVSNIELIEEIPSALEHGAEGIGLYRTEFLYANRIDYPTEDELINNFSRTLKMMSPKPVTIRTLDIGGDKLFYSGEYTPHVNPALGLRAIRFSLSERDMFRTQLRALLRSNNYGNLKIMLPMISDITELRQVKAIIEGIKLELQQEKIKFNDNFQLGIMIEVPSAVVIADKFAQEADFFSIGTNDLIQYTLAIDRTNENVSYLFKPLHPAILRMIKATVDAANNANIDVTVCGEMAGDPLYIMVLIGLGLNGLSMNPISIPRVKRIIRNLKYAESKRLVDRLLSLDTAEDVERLTTETIEPIIQASFSTLSKRTKQPKCRKKAKPRQRP
jgi:phosphotransferase system enzyme I (PtsI)